MADLASLKLNINKLDIDKVKTTPSDSGKLSNVLKNDVVEKTVYDDLVKRLMLLRPRLKKKIPFKLFSQ